MLWLSQAKEDLNAAKFNYKGKQYKVTAFLCQQSAEKALKAILIEKDQRLRKTHDLVALGRDIGISESILEELKELTLAYIYSRYPDVPVLRIENKIIQFLKTTTEVILWVDDHLKKN